jgi:hypothetical protein
MKIANTDEYEAWNGDSGHRWVVDADRRDHILAPIAEALLRPPSWRPARQSWTSVAGAVLLPWPHHRSSDRPVASTASTCPSQCLTSTHEGGEAEQFKKSLE